MNSKQVKLKQAIQDVIHEVNSTTLLHLIITSMLVTKSDAGLSTSQIQEVIDSFGDI